jgi:hypothetical protein
MGGGTFPRVHGGAMVVDGSAGAAPPGLGGVGLLSRRKFLAGQEGSIFVVGLIVNNKINSIIHDEHVRKLLVGKSGSGQINLHKNLQALNNPSK